MGKYKIFKIQTIKDWEGEYWDVYEEHKTKAGIMVYKGWPYGETPQNGGQANFYYILTNDKTLPTFGSHSQLPVFPASDKCKNFLCTRQK